MEGEESSYALAADAPAAQGRTQSELLATIWALAWPVIITFLLESLVGLIDTLMVARLGATAVAAVGVGAQILRHLGVRKMRILTNNPRKFRALDGYGLVIVERVPLKIEPNPANEKYLKTKKDKLGHLL